MLWILPVAHAANLMKYNCQFDEGPRGLKLNWDCMNEMSKCDTALPNPIHHILSLFLSGSKLAAKWKRGYWVYSSFIVYSGPYICVDFLIIRSYEFAVMSCKMRYYQCHICSSHSYNPNLTSGPLGPRQIGNFLHCSFMIWIMHWQWLDYCCWLTITKASPTSQGTAQGNSLMTPSLGVTYTNTIDNITLRKGYIIYANTLLSLLVRAAVTACR